MSRYRESIQITNTENRNQRVNTVAQYRESIQTQQQFYTNNQHSETNNAENQYRKLIQRINADDQYRKSIQRINTRNQYRESIEKVNAENQHRESI